MIKAILSLVQHSSQSLALNWETAERFKEDCICDKHHCRFIHHACQTQTFIIKFANECSPFCSAIHFLDPFSLFPHSLFPSPSLYISLFLLQSVCLLCDVNEFLLFLPLYSGLKDAEQQCNKGGSALIKYCNLLFSSFCCGNSSAKIDEALSDLHQKPTTSISQADCDGMPIEWPVCIQMSNLIL